MACAVRRVIKSHVFTLILLKYDTSMLMAELLPKMIKRPPDPVAVLRGPRASIIDIVSIHLEIYYSQGRESVFNFFGNPHFNFNCL